MDSDWLVPIAEYVHNMLTTFIVNFLISQSYRGEIPVAVVVRSKNEMIFLETRFVTLQPNLVQKSSYQNKSAI